MHLRSIGFGAKQLEDIAGFLHLSSAEFCYSAARDM
jgi:hypothetical protein